MSHQNTHGVYEHYPSRIPDALADVFLDTYPDPSVFPSMNGPRVPYDYNTQTFTTHGQINASHGSRGLTYRSLTPQPQNGLLKLSYDPTLRPSTPQPVPTFSTATKATTEMQRHTKMFNEAVEQYRKNAKVDAIGLDPNNDVSFDEVLKVVKRIENKYQNAESLSDSTSTGSLIEFKAKFASKIRLFLRKMERLSPAVTSWLRLLPGDSKEASLIVGGLKIIFEAAEKIGKLRDDTYDVLEAVPVIVARAQRRCGLYPNATTLSVYVSELYVSVLDAFCAIIRWYSKQSVMKVVEAAFKGRDTGAEITECLNRLKKWEKRIEDESNDELAERVGGVEQLQRSQHEELKAMVAAIALNEEAKLLRAQENTFYLEIERANIRKRLEDSRREHHEEDARRKQYVLQAISFDSETSIVDKEQVLVASMAFDREKQGYAAYIVEFDEVRRWIESLVSSTLVINAGQSHDMFSSASLASYMTARALEREDGTLVLSWFCGLHTEDAGVTSMVVDLIGQLLSSPASRIDLVNDGFQNFDAIAERSRDFHSLVQALRTLLKLQLRRGRVYMVLDGASWYESFPAYNYMSQFLQMLSDLGREERYSQCPFNLLLTSPATFTALTQDLVVYSTLDVSPNRFQNALSYAPVF